MKSKKLIALALISVFLMTMFSGCVIITKDGLKWKAEWYQPNFASAQTIKVLNKTGEDVSVSVVHSNTQETEPTFTSGNNVVNGGSLSVSTTDGNYVWVKAINNSTGKFIVTSHYVYTNRSLEVTIF